MKGRRLSALEAQRWVETGELPDWTKPKPPKPKKPRAYKPRPYKPRPYKPRSHKSKKHFIYAGIDGEGQTSPVTHDHRYTLLAVNTEEGDHWTISNPTGLDTMTCLRFICSFHPKKYKLFAFSFGYDITKILQDLDDESLYNLLRPSLRRRTLPNGMPYTIAVWWPQQFPMFSLNYMNGQLTVKARLRWDWRTNRPIFGKSHIVYDIWRFFQGKFTSALENWKVPGNITSDKRKEILAQMRNMKDKRSVFDRIDENEILQYCLDECKYMAELAHKLDDAHIEAGIPLKAYFGAGSSASAMLSKMHIQEHIQVAREQEKLHPAELKLAIACAFFGGRFENSIIGSVQGPIYSYDISSAYPYQTTFLPCLIHGYWEKSDEYDRMLQSRTSIVRYHIHKPDVKRQWAPLPFRFSKGSICFPEYGSEGFVWKSEFLAAEKLFPNVQFLDAWNYTCECDCQPFKKIPDFYRQRNKIGKEGPGIVLKLGINSCYGKTAQFIGGQPGKFTSWIWAGMITSGCRAQILDLMALHKDLDNLLMIATDGIASLERLSTPPPTDTGTEWCECPENEIKDKNNPLYRQRLDGAWEVNKPLGGWEEKIVKKNMFFARPGIYFPLNPNDDEVEKMRARGIGRAVLYKQWQKIVDAYERGERCVIIGEEDTQDKNSEDKKLSRFIGAKTAITRSGKPPWRYTRSTMYGRWEHREVIMTFNPLPKRLKILADHTLQLRQVNGFSEPYRRTVLSPESLAIAEEIESMSEQPDGGDYSEFD
jgi:hypothetical protein